MLPTIGYMAHTGRLHIAKGGRGGHYIGNCTPTHDQGQSEVKRSRQNFGAGQVVKV